jgi:hypothetical protein
MAARRNQTRVSSGAKAHDFKDTLAARLKSLPKKSEKRVRRAA